MENKWKKKLYLIWITKWEGAWISALYVYVYAFYFRFRLINTQIMLLIVHFSCNIPLQRLNTNVFFYIIIFFGHVNLCIVSLGCNRVLILCI